MSVVWQCPVCEGINQGGTTCSACGAPAPTEASTDRGAPERFSPPAPSRRRLVRRRASEPVAPPPEALDEEMGFHVRPMPGGCLFVFGPRDR